MSDRPELKVEISFVATPNYGDVWTDVSPYVILDRPPQIQRGRNDERESIQAGTVRIVLDNTDRLFDPANTASPYYPRVKPMKRIRISGVWDGMRYSRFTGFVREWQPERSPRDGKVLVVLDCVDGQGAAFALNSFEADNKFVSGALVTASTYDVLTGLSAGPTLGPPMTSLLLQANNTTSGTFEITFDGVSTGPLAWNITIADLAAALRALFGLSYGNLLVSSAYSDSQNLFGVGRPNGTTFYFGGAYVGLNITARISASSNLVQGGSSFFAIPIAPVAASIPGVIGRLAGRTLEVRIEPNPVYGVVYSTQTMYIQGVLEGSNRTQIETFNFTNSARLFTSAYSWAQIYSISNVGYSDSRNINATTYARVINPSTIPSALSGSMFYTVARYSGWRPEEIDAAAGNSTLQTLTLTGASPINLLQSITTAEGGISFVTRDGKLLFKDRAVGNVSGATFGFDLGELPYELADLKYGERYIKNDVRVTRDGGTTQRVADSASIEAFYPRILKEDGLVITSDSEALDRARYLLIVYKDSKSRIVRLVLRGEFAPDDLWPVLLSADLNDTFTVNYPAAPGADPDSYVVTIEAIRETITTTAWQIEWSLSPVAETFTLDDSLLDGDDLMLY